MKMSIFNNGEIIAVIAIITLVIGTAVMGVDSTANKIGWVIALVGVIVMAMGVVVVALT